MVCAGFSHDVVKWLKSYLNRFQSVRIKDRLSDMVMVPTGVAQGTVLRPLLFIFYINDIVACLNYVNISCFADDCVLYLAGNNWDTVRVKLNYN